MATQHKDQKMQEVTIPVTMNTLRMRGFVPGIKRGPGAPPRPAAHHVPEHASA